MDEVPGFDPRVCLKKVSLLKCFLFSLWHKLVGTLVGKPNQTRLLGVILNILIEKIINPGRTINEANVEQARVMGQKFRHSVL